MNRVSRWGRLRVGVFCVPLFIFAFPACQGDEAEVETCQTNEEFFLHQLWGPVISSNCMGCHNPQGQANTTNLVYHSASTQGFVQLNMGMMEDAAAIELDGESMLLRKARGEVDHGGGVRLRTGTAEYNTLAAMVARFDAPVSCDESSQQDYFEGVRLLDASETLRRATLTLVGRLPTIEEEQAVAEGGDDALRQVVHNFLDETAFYNFLTIAYNDSLLTDRYLGGDEGLDLLDEGDFPYIRWQDELVEGVDDPQLISLANQWTNWSIAREPLELINYVVRNDRPFTEILTADYRLVNGYSSRVYGIYDVEFDDPLDPMEWAEGRLEGMPMAGLLTSPMFLNRFPTTATNRNRHRARMVYQFFLATDVLKLAERPVDPTNIEDFNPTLYNPACAVCHAVVDPMAGAFQNWDEMGRYRIPEDGWFTDMRPPGFGDGTVGFGNRANSLQWLAGEITQDFRFAVSAVHILHRAMSGADPLGAPTDTTDANYNTELIAFDAQRAEFEEIAQQFIEDSYNLKTVVVELVLSHYFRAYDVDSRGAARIDELSDIGVARLLTPELLSRRIEAVLGYPWRRDSRDRDYLLNQYLIFYGGIDSEDVTRRITEPNGLISNIGLRMANEMSCLAVPQDLRLTDPTDRILFPFVDASFEPEDENGFIVEEALSAIRQNIRYLHFHLLGEHLSLNDPQLDVTYQMFLDTYREGRDAIADEESGVEGSLPFYCQAREDYWSGQEYPEDEQLREDEHYTVRAWMAVVSYLLSDYRFLHQ